MHQLTDEIIKLASSSVLCWLATVDAQGQPNVSPKEIWAIFDAEHVVIANIASPVSVRNIQSHPLVCVSFIDIFTQKGFKILGAATNIAKENPEYADWSFQLEQAVQDKFQIHSIIVIKVSSVSRIVAPSYVFYPSSTTETSQRQSALRRYGI